MPGRKLMPMLAIGLMSGTSMDGVDAALLRTDGERVEARGPAITAPYDDAMRARIRAQLGKREPDAEVAAVEAALTEVHARAIETLLAAASLAASEIAVVGFHGQTVAHDPASRFTWQIGDGGALAAAVGIDVVYDFRSADVAGGGEGAPLAPVYHRAIAADWPGPVAILNLGGVGNVTWIGEPDESGRRPMLAFDTGPGNALLDDWTARHTGAAFDRDARLARSGAADEAALARLMAHPYFARKPPKSLDRNDFDLGPVEGLSPADGAATLAAFTAAAVAAAPLPAPPRRIYVTGGGRRNPAVMDELARRLTAPVEPIEAAGYDGDAIEAEAFALMAVRRLRGLPISFPETTGVAAPVVGGRLARAKR